MSASTAIGMVDESLRNLLQGEMELVPAASVTVLGPDESGPPRRVNLFLYKLGENAFLKNKEWEIARNQPTRIGPPPLSLNLFYLVTPYAPSDPESGAAGAHEILGEAMRVLHEHPVLPASYLADGLQEARERVQVSLHQPDVDEMTKIWSTFGQPYRLSVMYEVSVVQIDMSAQQTEELAPRVQRVGTPRVLPGVRLPVVEAMSPERGPAGSSVSFSGSHLDGRRARVRVSGRLVLDAPIAGAAFSAMLPADLPLGFHRVQVDVSALCRRSFYFEVTA